jgi:hypothetical protein
MLPLRGQLRVLTGFPFHCCKQASTAPEKGGHSVAAADVLSTEIQMANFYMKGQLQLLVEQI